MGDVTRSSFVWLARPAAVASIIGTVPAAISLLARIGVDYCPDVHEGYVGFCSFGIWLYAAFGIVLCVFGALWLGLGLSMRWRPTGLVPGFGLALLGIVAAIAIH
jgi:hypothetical protein